MNEENQTAGPVERRSLKKRRPVWLRVIALVCTLLTAWHIFATFLWVAPNSALREAVPGNVLKTYMSTTFNQNWSVFAPKPIDSDSSFWVRAVVEGPDGAARTEWVETVRREMDLIHHNPFPARAAVASHQLASKYRSAFNGLSKKQKDMVGHHYYKGVDWTERLGEAFNDAASELGGSKSRTATFLAMEERAGAYATQVARAMWGENVRSIQYRVGRQGMIPFNRRNDPDAERPEPTCISTGWRGTTLMPGQNEEKFSEIFLSFEEVEKR